MRPDGGLRTAWRALILPVLALGLAALGPACSRVDTYKARLDAVAEDEGRTALRDTLWAQGSLYRWADHHNVQFTVRWTTFTPLAATPSDEVWLLDTAGGKFRLEVPSKNLVTLFNGWSWRFFAGGKPLEDLAACERLSGVARVAQELAPMPFSLLGPGLDIRSMGTATGPGEARAWQRLLVAYSAAGGRSVHDRMVVEIRDSTHRVEAAQVRWAELPFASRAYRVEMDEWHEHNGLVLAHRYRFYWADEKGAATGPIRFELRVMDVALDVPEKWGAFSQP